MKSIEEAAIDRAIHFEADSYVDFKAGVEFAQRWIPVEEDLPEIWTSFPDYSIPVLIKDSGDYKVAIYVYKTNTWRYECGEISNVTHWRPIELK